MIYTDKGFDVVNKAEVDVFLELSCFFDDSAIVGNLIPGSYAFSKSNLYKPLTVWITTNCGKFLKNGNSRPPDLPPEKSVCRSKSNS